MIYQYRNTIIYGITVTFYKWLHTEQALFVTQLLPRQQPFNKSAGRQHQFFQQ